MKRQLALWAEYLLIMVKPAYVMTGVILYLVLCWAITFLVDIRNFLGLREVLSIKENFVLGGEVAPLWFIIFREAGPTEILQWLALALTALCSWFIFRQLQENKNIKQAAFWKLIFILAVLMFLEDAANIRHLINYIIFLASDLDWSSVDGKQLRNVLELCYFAILGFIPAYAVIRYGRYIFHSLSTTIYLLTGCFFYGIAAACSGTRFLEDWYTRAGEKIYGVMQGLASGQMVEVATESLSMEFWLMDLLVEESLELLGAGALLSATLAYGNLVLNNQAKNRVTPLS